MSDPQVILSMTSIPARNGTLIPTLMSLIHQSQMPDQIRLYLTDGCQRPKSDIGMHFDELSFGGLTPQVYWTTDHGPLTKLSAAVDPGVPGDALIVTVDDDVIYDSNWLEHLVSTAKALPEDALGYSGWSIHDLIRGGTYAWPKVGETCDVLEGWAGAAYRKRWFRPDLFVTPKEFFWTDDVWISSYLEARGVKRRVIRTPMAKSIDHDRLAIHKRPDFVEINRRASRIGFPKLNNQPNLFPCGCSKHKVNLGMCDQYEPGGLP